MKPANQQQVMLLTSREDIRIILGDVLVDMARQMANPEWVSLKEAALLLGVSTGTVTDWRYTGKITYTQTSERVYMYSRSSINQILEVNRKNAFKKMEKY
ncbi:MAG: helix-turn-helix domain-containing protein [Paludibacteraceae bacterium]|jgi:hypothetical protein|nr:helix-turn-helix domain-containing protein [Paludibacteraceae bacterium]